ILEQHRCFITVDGLFLFLFRRDSSTARGNVAAQYPWQRTSSLARNTGSGFFAFLVELSSIRHFAIFFCGSHGKAIRTDSRSQQCDVWPVWLVRFESIGSDHGPVPLWR